MCATLESTTDGVLVTGDDWHVTVFNQNYMTTWEIPGEVMDRHDHRLLVDFCSRRFADPARYIARIDEIYAESPAETFDLLELADGHIFERYTRIQRVDGRNIGRVWSFRDITERRRAETQLTEQAEWLRVTLNSIGDAVLTANAEGRVLSLNAVAESLTGWSQDEARGRPVSEVFRIINEATREPAADPIQARLRTAVLSGSPITQS